MTKELEYASWLVSFASRLKGEGYEVNPLFLRITTRRLADLMHTEMEAEHDVRPGFPVG